MAKKLETYLNLTVTTALGIAGAVTGNVGLQIALYVRQLPVRLLAISGNNFWRIKNYGMI